MKNYEEFNQLFTYDCERAIMRDPRSGLRVTRITHHASISQNLYFEMCSFTEDERYFVFLAQRYGGRRSPWDVLRATPDGLELTQLTDADNIGGIVCSPANNAVFYLHDNTLCKVNIETTRDEEVALAPGIGPMNSPSLASIDAAGRFYFGSAKLANGKCVMYRADVEKGETEVLTEAMGIVHVHTDPTGSQVYFNEQTQDGWRCRIIGADGSNKRPYPFQFAHHTWIGSDGLMQGALLPPGNAIATFREGDAEPHIVASGRYYWHSSASADGQWIVSDTNWPQEGLYLIHVATGQATYVCDPKSSCSHPQWTHPHPSISPKLRYVLFNSDMTGVGQVYIAELTPEFLEKAASGYECRPNML